MRAVFVGAVESSAALLAALLSTPLEIAAVATLDPAAGARRHSDYADLSPLCRRHDLPCHVIDSDDRLRAIVAGAKPDLLLVWGWSRLIPNDVVAAARLGGIGFHPAPLPLGRGRHPLIWSIILGLNETAVTFFRLSEAADAGDILLQRRFPLSAEDDARSLMDKILAEASAGVPQLVSAILADGGLKGSPQDQARAVEWRKRSSADGRIDFRMPARGIDRLVRALTDPYPGAEANHSELGAAPVWRVRLTSLSGAARYAEPGRIVGREGTSPVVACGEDALVLIDHGYDAPLPVGSWFC